MGCFLFIFIDPQISQITQIMMFVCPVCLFSIIYRLHRFRSSVTYVSISSVRLFVCGAKIILFIRIIVVSAYVFSIIN